MTVTATIPDFHFIAWDEPLIGHRQRALCGELVEARLGRRVPTCPTCLAILADHERLLDQECQGLLDQKREGA